jgi:hypothetical protein
MYARLICLGANIISATQQQQKEEVENLRLSKCPQNTWRSTQQGKCIMLRLMWSSYDRIWFSEPGKQEILILIWGGMQKSELPK